MDTLPTVIELNVGGKVEEVSLQLLRSVPGSPLSDMFQNGPHALLDRDIQGRVFIDQPPDLFLPMIDYLRQRLVRLSADALRSQQCMSLYPSPFYHQHERSFCYPWNHSDEIVTVPPVLPSRMAAYNDMVSYYLHVPRIDTQNPVQGIGPISETPIRLNLGGGGEITFRRKLNLCGGAVKLRSFASLRSTNASFFAPHGWNRGLTMEVMQGREDPKLVKLPFQQAAFNGYQHRAHAFDGVAVVPKANEDVVYLVPSAQPVLMRGVFTRGNAPTWTAIHTRNKNNDRRHTPMDFDQRWCGGVALDQTVYFAPKDARTILSVTEPIAGGVPGENDVRPISVHLSDYVMKGFNKWCGAVVVDRTIVFIPFNANDVLRLVVPLPPSQPNIAPMQPVTTSFVLGDASVLGNSHKGKWSGGVALDRFVYCAPHNADCILRIEVPQNAADPFDAGCLATIPIPDACKGKQKWSGAVTHQHREESGALVDDIYFIPYKARFILRLRLPRDGRSPTTDDLWAISLPEEFMNEKCCTNYRWKDGVLHDNGIIYCAPVDRTPSILAIDTANTAATAVKCENWVPRPSKRSCLPWLSYLACCQ